MTVAIAIMCKTPAPGLSKTRLSPPLRPEECAAISACFIRDLSSTIGSVAESQDVTGYAVYTPRGSENDLLQLLPANFKLTPQCEGDFGQRLLQGIKDLLAAGHDGAILVNSDSPTLPKQILRQAADALRLGDNVVLSPAADGGYTLIGLSKAHEHLFKDIPWSTNEVFRLTVNRAREIGLNVVEVPGWYDVDDAASFQMLEAELSGKWPSLKTEFTSGATAIETRRFMRERNQNVAESA